MNRDRPDHRASRLCFSLLFCLWAVVLSVFETHAGEGTSLTELPTGPLGKHLQVLIENGPVMTVDDAYAQLRAGQFMAIDTDVPKFGIGAPPVWLHLPIRNNTDTPISRQLVIGISWLDNVDAYLLREGEVQIHRAAGDSAASLIHPRPGLGFVLEISIPPGDSDLFLRVATPDPMLIPVRLLDERQTNAFQVRLGYAYGSLYGLLLALILYNFLLAAGLRESSPLDYSLYLGAFALTHFAYTGHGYTWLWPDSPNLQRYVIPFLMVAFSCLGLRFAKGFLALRQHAPRTYLISNVFSGIGLLGLPLSIVLLPQKHTLLFAFVFVLLFSVMMVWLGAAAVIRGQVAGRYFLAAALAAMAGAACTALTVWVGIPYHPLTFHAAAIGMAIEGILLALALAYRMREYQHARQKAEVLARTDPLTQLLNRRALLELAEPLWHGCERKQRPFSVMMIDIDHFKKINDAHGHEAGDRVLKAIAKCIAQACRASDLAARWGGEEFLLILPETSLQQAGNLAERLRQQILALRCHADGESIPLSASIGVAQRADHENLEQLIRQADWWLYEAKQTGRNRVGGISEELLAGLATPGNVDSAG